MGEASSSRYPCSAAREVFLDDLTTEDVEKRMGPSVRVVWKTEKICWAKLFKREKEETVMYMT
jgi:hypothetical protein